MSNALKAAGSAPCPCRAHHAATRLHPHVPSRLSLLLQLTLLPTPCQSCWCPTQRHGPTNRSLMTNHKPSFLSVCLLPQEPVYEAATVMTCHHAQMEQRGVGRVKEARHGVQGAGSVDERCQEGEELWSPSSKAVSPRAGVQGLRSQPTGPAVCPGGVRSTVTCRLRTGGTGLDVRSVTVWRAGRRTGWCTEARTKHVGRGGRSRAVSTQRPR